MPESFLCEINPYDEVWLELGLHIPRNRRQRKFLVYYQPKVFQGTSNALICMPGGILREINQY